jgi:hypothetical protein
MIPSKGQHNEEDDNLINKNSSTNQETKRKFDDADESNVDPNKPQFERSDLGTNKEQRAGSGGGMDPDKNSGDR